MPDNDKEPKEQPKQEEEEQETTIILPEKDWQLALGNEKGTPEDIDDEQRDNG